jgi:uncharacterized protein DUF6933
MLLRCATKMLALLGVRPAALVEAAPTCVDWYLNLLWIERRKCLLLTHAGTLFPHLCRRRPQGGSRSDRPIRGRPDRGASSV